MSEAGTSRRVRSARLVWIGALGAALVVAAILWARGRSGRELRIEGRAVDAAGAPIAGVQISLEIAPAESEGELPIERLSMQSDARGQFLIRCKVPWRDASYNLEATKAGFETVAIDDAAELPNPLILRFTPAQR
jgi:hypothetical protein